MDMNLILEGLKAATLGLLGLAMIGVVLGIIFGFAVAVIRSAWIFAVPLTVIGLGFYFILAVTGYANGVSELQEFIQQLQQNNIK